MPEHSDRQCEEALGGRRALISMLHRDGEERRCPGCGAIWVHVCDEAEGCFWMRKADL